MRVANRSTRLQGGNIVRPQSRALSRHRCTVEVRSEDIGEERRGFLDRVLSITRRFDCRVRQIESKSNLFIRNHDSIYDYNLPHVTLT